jgi:hypothetical protein
MTLPKAKPRNHPSEKIEGRAIRARNRVNRIGNESLRAAAKRMIQDKDSMAPHLERWLTNKR